MTLRERIARDELAKVLEQAAYQARHGELGVTHQLILKSIDNFNAAHNEQLALQRKRVAQ